jgi:hypothetical protein
LRPEADVLPRKASYASIADDRPVVNAANQLRHSPQLQ